MQRPKNDGERALFTFNLRLLLDRAELTQKQAAEKSGVDYRWFRRMCHNGLTRNHQSNECKLLKVAEYFGLPSIDSLWDKSLTARMIDANLTVFDFDPSAAELDRMLLRMIWIVQNKEHYRELYTVEAAIKHCLKDGKRRGINCPF